MEGEQFINPYVNNNQIQAQYFFIIKATAYMQRKFSEYRVCSPIRGAIKSPMRGVSPIRSSPFSRQAPMSPIRIRKAQRSITPTKYKGSQRVQFTNASNNTLENFDTNLMQRTVKSGIGLFQQLANQHKIASQKKQNKYIFHNTNPFEYQDKKKECFGNYQKNSFGALIQNVKEIESIQASKGQYISHQFSFKTIEKSKEMMEGTIKSQFNVKRKNIQPFSLIDSFGSPKPSEVIENVKSPKNSVKKFEIKPQYEFSSQKKLEEPMKSELKVNPQVISSFQDVILLIKKASERPKEDSQVTEEDVRVSVSEDKDGVSFNMNPFI